MYFRLLTCIFFFITGVLSRHARIIGGQDADIKSYPYMVSIRIIEEAIHYCGGVIISNRHILTAAHCFDEYTYTELKIFTGSSLSSSFTPSYRILEVHIHPEFTGELSLTQSLFNDIAVIVVERCIRFNIYQNKISLPTENVQFDPEGKIMGWGMTEYPGEVSENLKMASSMIFNNTVCERLVSVPITDGQICALNSVGVGTCVGDSGGPIVNSNNELVGIGSFTSLCATGEPDVFTRVYYYLDFIEDVISMTDFLDCYVA